MAQHGNNNNLCAGHKLGGEGGGGDIVYDGEKVLRQVLIERQNNIAALAGWLVAYRWHRCQHHQHHRRRRHRHT